MPTLTVLPAHLEDRAAGTDRLADVLAGAASALGGLSADLGDPRTTAVLDDVLARLTSALSTAAAGVERDGRALATAARSYRLVDGSGG